MKKIKSVQFLHLFYVFVETSLSHISSGPYLFIEKLYGLQNGIHLHLSHIGLQLLSNTTMNTDNPSTASAAPPAASFKPAER